MLLSAEGEIIEADFDNKGQFLYSLQTKKPILDKGSYYIIVDAIWNQSANLDPMYKQAMVDLYGPELFDLQEVP